MNAHQRIGRVGLAVLIGAVCWATARAAPAGGQADALPRFGGKFYSGLKALDAALDKMDLTADQKQAVYQAVHQARTRSADELKQIKEQADALASQLRATTDPAVKAELTKRRTELSQAESQWSARRYATLKAALSGVLPAAMAYDLDERVRAGQKELALTALQQSIDGLARQGIELTAAQKAQLDALKGPVADEADKMPIGNDYAVATAARRRAETGFRQVLTPEQRAKLPGLAAEEPRLSAAAAFRTPLPGLNVVLGKLDLSEEQKQAVAKALREAQDRQADRAKQIEEQRTALGEQIAAETDPARKAELTKKRSELSAQMYGGSPTAARQLYPALKAALEAVLPAAMVTGLDERVLAGQKEFALDTFQQFLDGLARQSITLSEAQKAQAGTFKDRLADEVAKLSFTTAYSLTNPAKAVLAEFCQTLRPDQRAKLSGELAERPPRAAPPAPATTPPPVRKPEAPTPPPPTPGTGSTTIILPPMD